MSESNTDKKEKFKLTKKAKIIAAVGAVVLALGGVGGAYAYDQYRTKHECAAHVELFTDQQSELTAAITNAQKSLDHVTGEEPLPHTAGFASSDGKAHIDALTDLVTQASNWVGDPVPTCTVKSELSTLKEATDARAQLLTDLNAALKDYEAALEQYRFTQALEEANASMEEAKTALAEAQTAADAQLKVVDDDTALASVAAIKAAYDALKALNDSSHSLSTEVSAKTYDEAVASIDKAAAVVTAKDELNAATQALTGAIQNYRAAASARYSRGYSGNSGGRAPSLAKGSSGPREPVGPGGMSINIPPPAPKPDKCKPGCSITEGIFWFCWDEHCNSVDKSVLGY